MIELVWTAVVMRLLAADSLARGEKNFLVKIC